MHDLVHGTVATGAGAFRPGRDYTPVIDSDSESESEGPSTANTSQSNIDPSLHTVQSDEPIAEHPVCAKTLILLLLAFFSDSSKLDSAAAGPAPAPGAIVPPATSGPLTPLTVNGRKRPAEGHREAESAKRSRKTTATSGAIGEMASSV